MRVPWDNEGSPEQLGGIRDPVGIPPKSAHQRSYWRSHPWCRDMMLLDSLIIWPKFCFFSFLFAFLSFCVEDFWALRSSGLSAQLAAVFASASHSPHFLKKLLVDCWMVFQRSLMSAFQQRTKNKVISKKMGSSCLL